MWYGLVARMVLIAPECGPLVARIRSSGQFKRTEMARKPPTEIDEQLLRHIGNEPEGIGIDELLRLLDGEVSRRTLQRRLSVLVDAGRLTTEGAGRSTRYRLP